MDLGNKLYSALPRLSRQKITINNMNCLTYVTSVRYDISLNLVKVHHMQQFLLIENIPYFVMSLARGDKVCMKFITIYFL